MKILTLQTLPREVSLAKPETVSNLTLNSPALSFFTDFYHVKPLTIEASISALEAKKLMQKAHVKMKLVVNCHNEFIGLITANDLIDRRLVQKVSEGTRREELDLIEFMIPKSEIKALDYHEMSKAVIGDVISALKSSGQQHCLVVDHADNKIRGIFSASDISRQLRLPIDIQSTPNFYKVFSSLQHKEKTI